MELGQEKTNSIFSKTEGIGYTDMPARLPSQASQLYGNNLVNLLKLLCPEKDGQLAIDFEDPIMRGVTVTKDGAVTWPAPPIQVAAAPPKKVDDTAPIEPAKQEISPLVKYGLSAAGALLVGWIAVNAPAAFLGHFTVFVLACIIGYYVVWNVKHALHTPLMAITNAVSGIIVVGERGRIDMFFIYEVGFDGITGVAHRHLKFLGFERAERDPVRSLFDQ